MPDNLISSLQAKLRDFARERDWEQFHTPKNLAMALTVEAAELQEIFQWLKPEEAARLTPAQHQHLREELADKGERLKDAIETAMGRAASAIIDGNITNLIVVVVLYWFAGAEVKGFALVMGIGVFTTLAAGLIVTHVLLRAYQQGTGAERLSMLPIAVPAISRALRPSIDWIRYKHVFWAMALVAAGVCVAATVSRGEDIFETEFRGGTSMTMSTRAALPGEPELGGRLLMSRPKVEERLREVGAANAADPVLAELRGATVLTVGESTATSESTSFQIKVPNPVAIDDEIGRASCRERVFSSV